MTVLRGEVWIVDLGDPIGSEAAWERPAVVVSHDRLNAGAGETVVIVPGTSQDRGIDLHLRTSAREAGLPKATFFQPEHVRSISRQRLVRRTGRLSPRNLAQLDELLSRVLDLTGR